MYLSFLFVMPLASWAECQPCVAITSQERSPVKSDVIGQERHVEERLEACGRTHILRQPEAVAIGRVILQMELLVELDIQVLADSAMFLVELFGRLMRELVRMQR